jgi:hypothetical protein
MRSGHVMTIAHIGLLLGVAALTGCGWSYARKLEEQPTVRQTAGAATEAAPARPAPPVRPAPPPVPTATPSPLARGAVTATRVIPGARDLYTLGQNHRLSTAAVSAEDMQAHAFEVRLVDGVNDARRLIHCSTGKVVRAQQRPPGTGILAARERRGIPSGAWILEVDPTGRRPGLPNNDWYRHISRTHALDFVRQDPDGIVIYRYKGPRGRLAGPG